MSTCKFYNFRRLFLENFGRENINIVLDNYLKNFKKLMFNFKNRKKRKKKKDQ